MRNAKGTVMVCFKILSQNVPGWLEKILEDDQEGQPTCVPRIDSGVCSIQSSSDGHSVARQVAMETSVK